MVAFLSCVEVMAIAGVNAMYKVGAVKHPMYVVMLWIIGGVPLVGLLVFLGYLLSGLGFP